MSYDKTRLLIEKLRNAYAVVVGAGSGLSTAAGFAYDGERFQRYFSDFETRYGFHDMYSGVFYPYQTQEEYWGYFSRLIYLNRYLMPPTPVYQKLLRLVEDKDYFVLTTNVDHCFQRAGFDKSRLFYTQVDYGLLQCEKPCCHKTYDNEEMIMSMIQEQGFVQKEHDGYKIAEPENWRLTVPSELVPHCPRCGRPMTMNLRGDDTFVEDKGWHTTATRYSNFLNAHREQKVLFLELGVGMNTPVIIKYPFWRMTLAWPCADYICINQGQAVVPTELQPKSICINESIDTVFDKVIAQR